MGWLNDSRKKIPCRISLHVIQENRWLQESEIVTTITISKPTKMRAECGNVRDRKEKDVVLTGDEKVRYQEKKRTRKKKKNTNEKWRNGNDGEEGGLLG